MRMRFVVPSAALLASLLAGCAPVRRAPEWAAVREITPPALLSLAATDPSLATGPGGRLAIMWVTRDTDGGGDAWIALSADSGVHFAPPARLNVRDGSVDSYSESRPVAAFGPAGELVVAWAARRAGGEQADDIAARSSADGGESFGPVALLNSDADDPASRYHGFVALDVDPKGEAVAAWIDGRDAKLAPGEDEPARSTIRLARSADGGRTWRRDTRVADEVCSCCRIALRADSLGHVAVAYRGAHDDLRDPRLALSSDGGASFPSDTLVSADRWRLAGCPSIGSGVTLDEEGGTYAWYTGVTRRAAGRAPGVYAARWRLAGGAAGAAQPLADSLAEATHPLLDALGHSALVGVLAHPRAEPARYVFALRLLQPGGAMTPWLFLGSHAQAPAIAGTERTTAYAAWMEKTPDGPRVRAVRLERRPAYR